MTVGKTFGYKGIGNVSNKFNVMNNLKVIYKTTGGDTYKTITPESNVITVLGKPYFASGYALGVEILSAKRTVKAGYKGYCNVKANK